MSQVCALWNLGSKGQRSRSQCKDYWKWFLAHNCFRFTPILMKLHMQSPHESNMDPMYSGVKRSRSQCKDYWKWFQAYNCFPFTPIFMKLHMQSPYESNMDPYEILGSKGQRSRSQCKDYWKWFQARNCFPFTPVLMKLHMQSPHESSMGPMDFGVKRSEGQGHNTSITENGFWRITASALHRSSCNFTCSLPMSRI